MRPLYNKILLEIADVKIGSLQSDSIEEHGIIRDVGTDVDITLFPIGATLYFKAWAVDVITEGNVKYYFISADSDAICGIFTPSDV